MVEGEGGGGGGGGEGGGGVGGVAATATSTTGTKQATQTASEEQLREAASSVSAKQSCSIEGSPSSRQNAVGSISLELPGSVQEGGGGGGGGGEGGNARPSPTTASAESLASIRAASSRTDAWHSDASKPPRSPGGQQFHPDEDVAKVVQNKMLGTHFPVHTRSFRKKVTWQWKHKSGFKDYSQEESDRMEEHFQAGEWMMRMKSGKGRKAKPREIYFYDMIQLDPESGSDRKIKRVPDLTRWERLLRRMATMRRGFVRGEPKWWQPKAREWFEEQRKDKAALTFEEREAELYKVEGIWYGMTRTWTFSCLSVLAIFANAAWLYFDADLNSGTTVLDTDWGWIIGENAFCLWFTIELLVRFMAFRQTRKITRDAWFMLDMVLVVLMIFETWLLQLGVWVLAGESRSKNTLDRFAVLRSLRLLRLVRITRLFKVFPELFVLLKGVVHAMKSLIYTVIMLFVMTFITGVVLSNFAKQNEALAEAGFEKVGGAMWMLLLYGILMDAVSDVLNELMDIGGGYAFLFGVFIFLSNLTMLNMLIGILCEVVTRVTQEEMDETARSELEFAVTEILDCYDVNNNGRIQRAEFIQMTSNPDLAMILRRHDIDIEDLIKLEDVLFENPNCEDDGSREGPSFGYAEFLEKVFQLRGGNMSTVNDIVELRGFVNRKFKKLEEKLGIETPGASPTSSRPGTADTVFPRLTGAKSNLSSGPEHGGNASSSQLDLPGQVRTPVVIARPQPQTDSVAQREFQAAVLEHLSSIRNEQQNMRSQVEHLEGRVRETRDLLQGLGFIKSDGGGMADDQLSC